MSARQVHPTLESVRAKQAANADKPYSPSLVDRLMGAIQRLPFPYGLTYLTLFLLESIAIHVLAWMDGGLPAFTFSPLLLLFPLWLWGPLAIMTRLNAVSLETLTNLGPALDLQPEALRRLKYEFTTLPARNVIINCVLWAAAYFAIMAAAYDTVVALFSFGPVLQGISLLVGLFTYSIGGTVYYHTFRQLRLMNQTVKLVKHFDLFDLAPIYAVSVLTSNTGIAWIFLLSLSLLIFPIQNALVPTLALLTFQVGFALAAFGLPLRIVSLRLLAEKGRLLSDNDKRFKLMLARLHRCLDDGELGSTAELKNGIDGLNIERNVLVKLPVLPWRPGLLTGFLSLISLPILLFLAQYALGKWLGG
jgi:hypothetical protein